ncbi:MAG: thioredoxin family protein [Elusimicrobiota bacterium]
MVLTSSTMMQLGTPAPDFRLPDAVSGKDFTLASFAGKDLFLAMFICRHCPYVQHVKEELGRLGRDYVPKGVAVAAFSANDAAKYPDDAPASLAAMAREEKFNFPFLFDETQETAKTYTAACTPDFFLFDKNRRLIYRGQLDDSRPGNGKPVTGRDLRAALDAALAGKPVPQEQRPSAGCNIKWKPGNEPVYFR